MPTAVLLKRALITSALFLSWVSIPAWACAPDHIDETATVAWVYDGDTLRLKDGRKLRLIGINAPEMPKEQADAAPLARAATQYLIGLIEASDKTIRIRYDLGLKDRYGRLLAHIYTTDDRNITAEMIERGLGAAITVPPNSWAADCYYQAEQKARDQRRGIWKDAVFGPTNTTQLPRDSEGFHIVTGDVVRIGKSNRATWINLAGDVALRIDHSDKPNFPDQQFTSLQGRKIEARGWIYQHKGQLRMRIRHPRSLAILQ
jgi:endonuclease YncB( thermonuclease family)